MQILELIFQAATPTIVVLSALWVRSYLPSYVQEKAKNLATKEDITDITEKIEKVRSEYAQTLESIKSEIQLSASIKDAFQKKSLEAIQQIDSLLISITIYCHKELSKLTEFDHYVWPDLLSDEQQNTDSMSFINYKVRIQQHLIMYGLYLPEKSKLYLQSLAGDIDSLIDVEMFTSIDDVDEQSVEMAEKSYLNAIQAVERCKVGLLSELGVR